METNELAEEKRIAIVDLDSIVYTAGYAKDFEKSNDMLMEHSDSVIKRILSECDATHYIMFIKGSNTIKSRLIANPEYKQNRKDGPPPYWNFVRQHYIDKWGAISVDNMEVDDACIITRKNTPNSFIVAIDKDLLFTQGKNYNWKKKEWLDISEEQAKIFFLTSMIVGDSVDNIKGLPGKGIKWCENRWDTYIPTAGSVLDEYILQFGEKKGVEEFYKNYSCLKIIDNYEGWNIPNLIEINRDLNNNNGDGVWETEQKENVRDCDT